MSRQQQDSSLEAMKHINPVLFELIMCNSAIRGFSGNDGRSINSSSMKILELKKILNGYETPRTSSTAPPANIERTPLTSRTMERKRKVTATTVEGKLPKLVHEDSDTFITGLLSTNNEQQHQPLLNNKNDSRCGVNDRLRESLMREVTPPFKSRKTVKTSVEDKRKLFINQDHIEPLSNYTEEENIKQTKLMQIYEKKQFSVLRSDPALACILRYVSEARTPRDRSLFVNDYEFIQKMIIEERELFNNKDGALYEKKKTKRNLKVKQRNVEQVNIFERDLPKALRQRITDIKNNPAFMSQLEELRKQKKKALQSINAVVEQHDGEGQ